jgi:hypothetical protein
MPPAPPAPPAPPLPPVPAVTLCKIGHGAATRDLDAIATAAADRTIAAGTNPAIAAVSTGPAIERAENIGAGSARTTAPAVTRCTTAPAAAPSPPATVCWTVGVLRL